MGAVADEGRCLLFQRGDDQLADLTVGEHLAGGGIDDLEVEIIVPVVHTVVARAVDGDAGAVDLRQTVDVEQLDAEILGDARAH